MQETVALLFTRVAGMARALMHTGFNVVDVHELPHGLLINVSRATRHLSSPQHAATRVAVCAQPVWL